MGYHKIIVIFWFSIISQNVFPQGFWSQKNNFAGPAKSGAVAFSIANKGYIGTGNDSVSGLSKDFWEYDPATDVWTQKANITGEYGRQYAVGFSIGNFGYVGTGQDNVGSLKDFRQYDPVLNKWTNKAKFSGDKRSSAAGFSIGDKGYIGTGYGSSSDLKGDFYEYDPITDIWTQIADLPGADRTGSVGFSIGNKGYVAFGSKSFSGASTDLYEYDPSTGAWTQKTSCPGNPRIWPVAFVIDGKAYAGTGVDDDFNNLNDFWQYDPATDTWMEVDSLPGSRREHSVGFAIGEKGYVGTGQIGFPNFLNDFWEFTPGCAAPTNLVATNISPSSAKLKWDAVVGATKYKVQYKVDSIGAPWVSKTINASKTSITINSLNANTAYKWKVRSICGDEHSDYSAAQTFTTLLRLSSEEGNQSMVSVFPNPFSASGVLSFYLEENTSTTVEVFNLAGRKTMLLNETLDAGKHEVMLSREQIGEGIFLVKLITGNQTSVIKVIVQ